jgi:hypothetical protein
MRIHSSGHVPDPRHYVCVGHPSVSLFCVPPAPPGEGLEEDEVESYAAMLPRTLAALPGGGLRHGSILTVQDQSQHFGVDIIVVHAVRLCWMTAS